MSMLDLTRPTEIIDVRESLAFFVEVETGARGNRIARVAAPFQRVLFTRLLFAPVGDILGWEKHLSNIVAYIQRRPLNEPLFYELCRDLMDGLRPSLTKALTRNRWSRIVALFTYQQLEGRLREIVFDPIDGLHRLQRAWEAEFETFSGLEGALPRDESLPRALADAVVDFYQHECQERLPPAVALFLAMRAIEQRRVYAEALAARTELAVYRGVLMGTLQVDPENNLAVSYVRALQTQGVRRFRPLPPQPSPFGSRWPWVIAVGVLLFLFGATLVLIVLVTLTLLYVQGTLG